MFARRTNSNRKPRKLALECFEKRELMSVNSGVDMAGTSAGVAEMHAASELPVTAVRPTLLISTHGLWTNCDAGWDVWEGYTQKIEDQLEQRGSTTVAWQVDWDSMKTNREPVAELRERITGFLNSAHQTWDVLFFGHSRGAVFNNQVLADFHHDRLGTTGEISLDPTAATLLDDRYPRSTDAAISTVYSDGYDLLSTMGGLKVDHASFVDLHDDMKNDPPESVKKNAWIADKIIEQIDSKWGTLFARVGQAETDSILYHMAIEDYYFEHADFLNSDLNRFVAAKTELSASQLKELEKAGVVAGIDEIVRVNLGAGTSPQMPFENLALAAINSCAHDRDNNFQVAELYLDHYVDMLDQVPVFKDVIASFKEALQQRIDHYLQSLRSTNLETAAGINVFLEDQLQPLGHLLDKAIVGKADWKQVAAEMVQLTAKWMGSSDLEWLNQQMTAIQNAAVDSAQELRGQLIETGRKLTESAEQQRNEVRQRILSEIQGVKDAANNTRHQVEDELNNTINYLKYELKLQRRALCSEVTEFEKDLRREATAACKEWNSWLKDERRDINKTLSKELSRLDNWLDDKIHDLPKAVRGLGKYLNPLRDEFNRMVKSAQSAAARALDKAEARAEREIEKIDDRLDHDLAKAESRLSHDIDKLTLKFEKMIAREQSAASDRLFAISQSAIDNTAALQAKLDAELDKLSAQAFDQMALYNKKVEQVENTIQQLNATATAKIAEFSQIYEHLVTKHADEQTAA